MLFFIFNSKNPEKKSRILQESQFLSFSSCETEEQCCLNHFKAIFFQSDSSLWSENTRL